MAAKELNRLPLAIRAVTFDLWLTLIWDSKELEEYRRLRRLVNFHRFAMKFAKDNGNGTKDFNFNRVRLALEELEVRIKGLYDRGLDVHPDDRGRMLFDILRIRLPRKNAQHIYERAGEILSNSGYRTRFPNVNPEAKPTLRALKEENPEVKIGLVSNAARSAATYRRILRSYGISEYFDSLTISCEVGFLKPRKEIFDAALHSLRVKPQDALHVGDLFRADIVGAASLGMNAALYTGLWHKYAHYMIPGEHIPNDFKPPSSSTIITEISSLKDTVELARKLR